ncbi:MAG TPA: MarR family transcriptional regulator [Gemmatimonadaceae bacterium]|nr:MarR family transcriptional regulator [Gemmatimonadaceae bacterium]
MNAATRKVVEQFGVLLCGEGYARIAGRLMGFLLLARDPVSLEDLAGELEVSKASISTNIRLLEDRGIVDRVGVPGDRRDYYQIADDMLARSIEQRLAKINRFRDAVNAARNTVNVTDKRVRQRLAAVDEAYQHLGEIMTTALTSWRAASATSPARPR